MKNYDWNGETMIKKLPVIYLYNTPVFPFTQLTVGVFDKYQLKNIRLAVEDETEVFFVLAKNRNEKPAIDGFAYSIGVIGKITKFIKTDENHSNIFINAYEKCICENYFLKKNTLLAQVSTLEDLKINVTKEFLSKVLALVENFRMYYALSNLNHQEILNEIILTKSFNRKCDLIGTLIDTDSVTRQYILEIDDLSEKIDYLLEFLSSNIEIIQYKNTILQKVKKTLDENQKKYFIREQIKVLTEELGEKASIEEEVNLYKEKFDKKQLPKIYKEKVDSELKRLSRSTSVSQEGNIIRDYLDKLVDLPFTSENNLSENFDINKAKQILNQDHFGLIKIKQRIIEFIAVKQYANNVDAPIICLVGPPGVGKTSIGKSIAKSLNLEYSNISLGGMRDEAELRGHRRTYLGAMTGKIIQAISTSKTNNPLILLDEIDKIGADHKGDPASALLEILDPNQNKNFVDNYIGLPFDISKVTFICTANTISSIPAPLFDRLEILQLSSYTFEEKLNIAKQFLLPKILNSYKLSKNFIKVSDEVFIELIKNYTREAGVRDLNRILNSLVRKILTDKLSSEKKSYSVTINNLEKFIGRKKYVKKDINTTPFVGITKGLAFTPIGGVTLSIEAICMTGNGKLESTGNIGKIMSESLRASLSFVRSNAKEFGIDENFYKTTDIHVHIPEGATPKDGPSAGVGLITSIVSCLSNKKVNPMVAMTGEISITGRVMAIGGLKEKLLAAIYEGIETVYIPLENKPTFLDLEDFIKNNINIKYVSNVREILDQVLL